MIKANELRVGNIIYDNLCGAYAVVLGVESNLVKYSVPLLNKKYDDCAPDEDVLIPIPLTEEILLKCGFEHTTEGGTQYFKIVIKYSKALSLLQDEGESDYGAVLSVSEGTFIKSHSVIGLGQMQHLHQLQNLYFALTGEELNVEL